MKNPRFLIVATSLCLHLKIHLFFKVATCLYLQTQPLFTNKPTFAENGSSSLSLDLVTPCVWLTCSSCAVNQMLILFLPFLAESFKPLLLILDLKCILEI